MNFIRYLLLLPACVFALSIVNWAFGNLMLWFIELNTFWLIVVLLLFGSLIWELFKNLSGMFLALTSAISPNRNVSFWIIASLSVLNGFELIYDTWTFEEDYSLKMNLTAIAFTFLVIELTISLIVGAAVPLEQENYNE